jgi:hypothetical protein
MGLKSAYLDYIYESVMATVGSLQGKRMLELGNQHIFETSIREKTGKEYYSNRGVQHTSVDLNGLDGAIEVDLSKPIEIAGWNEYFDIVTNSGTSEHVSPKKAQYECFMNIHKCLKVGGVAIHLIPDIDELVNRGYWKNHCKYYYSGEFVKMLIENNSYKLVSSRIIGGLICFSVQKMGSVPFMKDREEFLKYIVVKKSGIRTSLSDNGWSIRARARFRSAVRTFRERVA